MVQKHQVPTEGFSKEVLLVNTGKATKNQSFKDYWSAVFICQMEKNGRVYLSRRLDMAFETYKQ